MSNNQNSAQRILSILEKHNQIDQNLSGLVAWGQLFEIEEKPQLELAALVTQNLLIMHYELDYIKQKISEKGISENRYASAFAELKTALSASNLNNQWFHVTQYFSEKNLSLLGNYVDFIGNEGDDLSLEEIQEIQNIINELKQNLESSSLPPHIKILLRNYARLIETALNQSKIVGKKSLYDIIVRIIGDHTILKLTKTLDGLHEEPAIQSMNKLVSKLITPRLDDLARYYGYYEAASGFAEIGGKLTSNLIPIF